MSENEIIDRAQRIISLFRDKKYQEAREEHAYLRDDIRDTPIADRPEILSLILDLEFLTDEIGTIGVEEVEDEIWVLRGQIPRPD